MSASGRLFATAMSTVASAVRPRASVTRRRIVRVPALANVTRTSRPDLSSASSPSTSQVFFASFTGEAESSDQQWTECPATTEVLSQAIRATGSGRSATCTATWVSVTLPALSVTRRPTL
jgi:hypothetical protein